MKKFVIFIFLVFSLKENCLGQQHPMMSQYLFNGFIINPAYAGSQRPLSTIIHYRRQWWGFEGAPKTGLLAVDGMLPGNKNALGLIISNDKIGVTTESEAVLNYAFHFNVADRHRISLGLRGGISHYSANLTDLTLWDPDDEIYLNNISGRILPKAGFGAYYYSPKIFAGVSIPTLIAYDPGKHFNVDIGRASFFRRHYFATTGFLAKINNETFIRPSVLIKYIPEAPLQADFTCSVLLMDALITGLTYRTGESVLVLVEFQIKNGLRIGYSYDLNFTKIATFSRGTHEAVIGWDLIKINRILRPF
jgi:type IX secretion system PorP/SprF family membrane protein